MKSRGKRRGRGGGACPGGWRTGKVFSDSFSEFLETLLPFFQYTQPLYSLIRGHTTQCVES